jgi:hypothetical protein
MPSVSAEIIGKLGKRQRFRDGAYPGTGGATNETGRWIGGYPAPGGRVRGSPANEPSFSSQRTE